MASNNKLIFGFAGLAAGIVLGAGVQQALADQPKMHDALGHLHAAESALQAADNDKGGHRLKALKMTRGAINQVEMGISFDRRH